MSATALVWLRRDLRLEDNPALCQAAREFARVVPVLVLAPGEESPWEPGAASRWWLHRSLESLDADLRRRGSALVIRRGPTIEALCRLVEETGAEAVYWNRLYEPALIDQSQRVHDALRTRGVRTRSFNAALLLEPWENTRANGAPYRVFTPFYKSSLSRLAALSVEPAPRSLRLRHGIGSLPVDQLGLLPRTSWYGGLETTWMPGEPGAHRMLSNFLDRAAGKYEQHRDLPSEDGTSRLSPHLHFGEIGPRQVWLALEQLRAGDEHAPGSSHIDAFQRQLIWRELTHHLLYYVPQTPDRPLNEKYEDFPWTDDETGLAAWQRGETGIPWVDAGMRQLWATGWMHNRVRMAVASLLTKNLGIHWLEGARWFWDTLVDADLASNAFGWQWTAGCGADAAPYFRIFNPVLQGQRFDPDGAYVRRWLPALSRLPARYVHIPWAAPAGVLEQAGLKLGEDYPGPILDLAATRASALDRLREWRGRS